MKPQTSSPPRSITEHNEVKRIRSHTLEHSEMIAGEVKKKNGNDYRKKIISQVKKQKKCQSK